MSEVVTGVVKLTFGFLANKIRSGIAERLKDGDITDEDCRRLIVRELDDIKNKLDGLARKDLLSSLCFLQEGINGLYQSLHQLDSIENTAESTQQATLAVQAVSPNDTGPHSPVNEAIALINAMTSLKIRSKERFKSAMKSFELAREKATEAFCNEALSIEDRIQASQIRMMARILEKLEDPGASVGDCLQYLKQLHDIRAIQEIFSVLIDGGIKSRFNKTKRLNNASSVQVMNQILCEFVKKFTKSSSLKTICAWPAISLGGKTLALFGEDRIIEKLEGSGMQVMSVGSDFTFGDEIHFSCSALNSKGEIVALTNKKRTFKVFKRSGDSHTLCEAPKEEHASQCDVESMDVDIKDNLYVITTFRDSDDQSCSFKLFIFDENGNKKLEYPLPFYQSSRNRVCMAINKNGKIAILDCKEKILYIGNVCVELSEFQIDESASLLKLSEYSYSVVRFSNSVDGTLIAADKSYAYICTKNGKLQRKIEKPTKYGYIHSVAINPVTKRILVKTNQSSDCSLLRFSDTGELQDSLCLGSSEWIRYAYVTSHPNGPVALVGGTRATLLQL